jgi:hypothetical protein
MVDSFDVHHNTPLLSLTQMNSLLERVDNEIESAQNELRYAQPIAEAAGLSVHSSILDPSYQNKSSAVVGIGGGAMDSLSYAATATSEGGGPAAAGAPLDLQQEAALVVTARQIFNPLRGTLSAYPLVLSTTGGHSNSDHIVNQNADGTVDRLSEYKRRYKRRFRQEVVEHRGSDRWDLPRRPGGRRRRIKRDVDCPTAPPEPPNSGYVIYVSQMTTKLRYNNPKRHHNQINAVRKISSLWHAMTEQDRGHYKQLAKDATREYEDRRIEYRATGIWTPYSVIQRLGGQNHQTATKNYDFHDGEEDDDEGNDEADEEDTAITAGNSQGPWVRIPYSQKNDLEKELETYTQVVFPPRPKEMEEAYMKKMEEKKARRKRKLEEDLRMMGIGWS